MSFFAGGLNYSLQGGVKNFLKYYKVISKSEADWKYITDDHFFEIEIPKYKSTLKIWFGCDHKECPASVSTKRIQSTWNEIILPYSNFEDLLRVITILLKLDMESNYKNLKVNTTSDNLQTTTPTPCPSPSSGKRDETEPFIIDPINNNYDYNIENKYTKFFDRKSLLQACSKYCEIMEPKINGGIKKLIQNPTLLCAQIYINPKIILHIDKYSRSYLWHIIHNGPWIRHNYKCPDPTFWVRKRIMKPFSAVKYETFKKGYILSDESTGNGIVTLRLYRSN